MTSLYTFPFYIEYKRRRKEYHRIRVAALRRYQVVKTQEPPICTECGSTQAIVLKSDYRKLGQVCCELPECPYCGEFGGQPVLVEDADASVGYHCKEEMCTLCAPRLR